MQHTYIVISNNSFSFLKKTISSLDKKHRRYTCTWMYCIPTAINMWLYHIRVRELGLQH